MTSTEVPILISALNFIVNIKNFHKKSPKQVYCNTISWMATTTAATRHIVTDKETSTSYSKHWSNMISTKQWSLVFADRTVSCRRKG